MESTVRWRRQEWPAYDGDPERALRPSVGTPESEVDVAQGPGYYSRYPLGGLCALTIEEWRGEGALNEQKGFTSCLFIGERLDPNSDGEFDPGSGRTLAACLKHASRTDPSGSVANG